MIGIDDEDDSTFTITVDGKMFHFQGKNHNIWETHSYNKINLFNLSVITNH